MTTTTLSDPILSHLKLCLPRLAPLLVEDRPMKALGLDSMDTVELLCAVHHEFGVRLTENELNPDFTLQEFAERIAEKIPS